MCDYIDRLRNSKKVRSRTTMENNFSNDETVAPSLAPRWTHAGYKGRLKEAVIEACNDRYQDADIEEEEEKKKEVGEKEEGRKEGEEEEMEEVEETVLLTSEDRKNSDDKMND